MQSENWSGRGAKFFAPEWRLSDKPISNAITVDGQKLKLDNYIKKYGSSSYLRIG